MTRPNAWQQIASAPKDKLGVQLRPGVRTISMEQLGDESGLSAASLLASAQRCVASYPEGAQEAAGARAYITGISLLTDFGRELYGLPPRTAAPPPPPGAAPVEGE